MVKVELKPAVKVPEMNSLFVSFPYSMENVSKIKSVAVRYYHPEVRCWEVPVSYLNELVTMFEDVGLEITGKEVPVQQTKQTIKNDFEFKTAPFPHQIECFDYAKNVNQFLLGDEQGLGKTKQCIDIAVSKKHEMKHCLIVCGVNSLKHNWMREVEIHSNEKGRIIGTVTDSKGNSKDGTMKDRLADLFREDINEFFLITNIETLRNKEILQRVETLTKSGLIGMVVVDEIHKCKNPQSQQGKAIHGLKSKYKIAASGTPLMNSPLDCYNVLKWLGQEKNSFYSYRARYCNMGGFGGYEVVGYKNMAELHKRISKVMLRRKKDEVLNLPPKIRSIEYVEMNAKQEQLYKQVKLAIQSQLDEIELSLNPLAILTRLRQVTAHPVILTDNVKESAKFDRMVELVEELAENGKKVIIFSNWESVTELAKEVLKEFNPAYITGSVKDRQSEVDKFQKDSNCSVIIGTIGAMGTGLTLTAASTVIFLDKPWNMANTEQAEDRAHRIGTTGTVNIITLVCKNTIDEKIENIINSKGDIAQALVDGKLEKLHSNELLQQLLS